MFVVLCNRIISICFFFNHPATTEIYTLSLHDALPIYQSSRSVIALSRRACASPDTLPCTASSVCPGATPARIFRSPGGYRSEEHTSELQSRRDLVCRLLLEKKNVAVICW